MFFGISTFVLQILGQGAEPHWWEQFTGLRELLILLAALGIIGIIFRYARGGSAVPGDFVIRVKGDDVRFSGRFPAGMQTMVANFLRNDVGIRAAYEVRGHWEGSMLVVIVNGEAARPVEQRIRNFLKLNMKRP